MQSKFLRNFLHKNSFIAICKYSKRKNRYGKCASCNKKLKVKNFEVDHVKPLSKLVSEKLSDAKRRCVYIFELYNSKNMQLLCSLCHKKKTLGKRKIQITSD